MRSGGQVTEIKGALQWPLDVYGHVAVRDSLDKKRNYLFRRIREDCQTLASPEASVSPVDSYLKLTGPSRAVVLIDPVFFEVDLKVKSIGTPFECEDKVLSYHCFCYNNIPHMGNTGFAQRKVESTEHSTMEFVFAPLSHAVEATIEIHVIEGSADFKACFTARTIGINEDVMLLDSLDRKVTVASDGLVALDRRVVSVEEEGEVHNRFLSVYVQATEVGGSGKTFFNHVNFIPRVALRSQLLLQLEFCKLSVEVAWSMLS
ncbi:uncharacterized protein C2845_PM05G04200 [Panicum miliaceum]|uniref:DUF6598 domain-containing protein n=1 Tax=Panicum miliaceum TaxID=4540 RepID=A0A3L6T1P7_PANMI|nr:uncharacterized protein C2845_PM05G04200 [Panicum miliaceum]